MPNGVGGRPPHGSNQYTSHRTTSNNTVQSSSTTKSSNNKTISYTTNQTNQEVHTLKNEMSELKSRVVNMSSNIDLLTNMVQKVTVHDFDGAAEIGAGVVSLGDCQLGVVVGNKRKKMGNITNNVSYYHQGQDQGDIIMPDWNPSSSCVSGGIDPFTLITADGNDDDTLLSAAAGDAADPLPDLAISSSSSGPLPDLAMSTADVMAPSSSMSAAAADVAPSSSNGGGDDTFVDDLFQAFADEESLDDAGLLQDEAAAPSSSTTPTSNTTGNKDNVCPKLMKRIEDSLSTIPQEMHELVAKKLIDAISDTKPIVEGASSFFSQGQGGVAAAVGGGGNSQGRRSRSNSGSSESSFKKTADRSVSIDSESTGAASGTSTQPSIPLPIAVSALKTILAEYGVKVECKMDGSKAATRRGSSCSKDADPRFKKSSLLPVVPMHA